MGNAIPEGWASARIGDLCDLINGRAFKPSDWAQEGLPIVRIQNLNDPRAAFNYYDKEVSEKFYIDNEELLFAWSGTPGTSFGAHIWRGGRAILNQHIFRVLLPEHHVDKQFFQICLNQHVSTFVSKAHGGVGLGHITKGKFEETIVPLPPLNEQRRIVARLEELQGRVRAARAALDALPPLLDRFRQSVLAAAFRGDLTADWRAQNPDVEPASELLKRIRAERRRRWEEAELEKMRAKGKTPSDDRWKAKYVEPEGVDVEELPELPRGWTWASVEETSEVEGGIQKQPSRRVGRDSVPFLRVANVHWGRLDLAEVHTIELFDGELDRLRLVAGDLLVVEGNGSPTEVGRMAVWDGSIEDCVHQNHLIRIRPAESLDSLYLARFWSSPVGRSRVFDAAQTTTGLYNLSKGKVSRLPVPLAPAEEQKRLLRIIEPLLASASSFDAVRSAEVSRLDHLQQSLLARAFRGELVPQDPDDEPASVLLERLRAEREAAGEDKTRRGRRARESASR